MQDYSCIDNIELAAAALERIEIDLTDGGKIMDQATQPFDIIADTFR